MQNCTGNRTRAGRYESGAHTTEAPVRLCYTVPMSEDARRAQASLLPHDGHERQQMLARAQIASSCEMDQQMRLGFGALVVA
jgi:hypothetical protein